MKISSTHQRKYPRILSLPSSWK